MLAPDFAVNPIERLEHDHVPLGELVGALRSLLNTVAREERSPADVYGEVSETVAQLRDDLLEHFGREEEGFFPFLLEALPDAEGRLAELSSAHDTLCGSLTRLTYLASRGAGAFIEQFRQVEALFERFESLYVEHARDERATRASGPRCSKRPGGCSSLIAPRAARSGPGAALA
ncbi:MAG: hemerythrin domain-containing protein [Polyangiaceae bacterium]|nr:hemerythrin domain-containing protein [Polyangiaceae bacterium]